MTEEGESQNIVGSAAVEVTADTTPFEEGLAEKIQAILDNLNAEVKVSPRVDQSRAEKPTQATEVDAKVKSVEGVADAIKSELKASFQLRLDLTDLRKQIEAVFIKPFTIKLEAEAGQRLAGAVTGAPSSSAAVPDRGVQQPAIPVEVKRALANVKGLPQTIDELYATVQHALEAAGKKWGSFSDEQGNQAEKLLELTRSFGSDITTWVDVTQRTKGGVPRRYGGPLLDQLQAEGAPTGSIGAFAYQIRSMLAGSPEGQAAAEAIRRMEYRQRAEETEGTAKVISPAPPTENVVITPASPTEKAPEPIERPARQLTADQFDEAQKQAEVAARESVRKAVFHDAATLFERFAKPEPAPSGLRAAIIGEPENIPAGEEKPVREPEPRVTGTRRGGRPLTDETPGVGPDPARRRGALTRPDAEPADTARFLAQAGTRGGFRENDRTRLNPGVLVGETQGGIKVDLRPFLEAVSRGGTFVEETKGPVVGKDAKGKPVRGQPRVIELEAQGETPGELLQSDAYIRALARRRRPFTLPNLPGVEGQVRAITGEQAITRLAQDQFAGQDAPSREQVAAFVARPEVQNEIRLALREARNKSAGDANRGAGNFTFGQSPEAYMRAGLALDRVVSQHKDTLNEIDDVWEKIETRSERGLPTDRLERRLATLDARRFRLEAQAGELAERAPGRIRPLTPEERATAARADLDFSRENRSRIERGEGLDPFQFFGGLLPGVEGEKLRKAIDAKLLPEPEVVNRAIERFTSPDFAFQPRPDTTRPALKREEIEAEVEDARKRGVPAEPAQARLADFDAAVAAGKIPSVFPLRPEGKLEAFSRVFMEEVGPFLEQFPKGSKERTEAESFANELRKAIGGRGSTVSSVSGESLQRSSPGLIPTLDEFARQDVDRSENRTTGAGRVIERDTSRGSVGESITADRFTTREERAEFAVRNAIRQGKIPATSIDARRQDIEGALYKALNNPPDTKTAPLLDRITRAERRFEETPASESHERLTELKGLQAQRDALEKPVKEEVKRLEGIREAAIAEIRSAVSGGATSIEEVREAIAKPRPGDVYRSELRTPTNPYGLEGKPATDAKNAARLEALELLQHRMPGFEAIRLRTDLREPTRLLDEVRPDPDQYYAEPAPAAPRAPRGRLVPSPATRAAPEPKTSEELAAKFAAAGGVVPGGGVTSVAGGAETPPPPPDAGTRGPGGPRGPRRTAAGGDMFDGYRGGQIHVIIDGQPVRVTMAEGGPGGGGGGQTFQEQFTAAGAEDRRRRAGFRAETGAANLQALERQVERLRQMGKTDAQIKNAITKGGFPAASALLFDEEGTSSGRAARRERLGLGRLRTPISSEALQESDAERAALSAEAERAERRILKRGFIASFQDVLQGGFFEKQAAAVDRFRRESVQLTSVRELEARQVDKVRDATEERTRAESAAAANPRSKQARTDLINSTSDLAKEEGVLRDIRQDVTRQREIVAGARAALPGRVQAAGNIAIGGAASAVALGIGGIAFTIGSQIAGAIQQGLVEASGPLIDRLSGFAFTAQRVTGALSDQVRLAPEAPSVVAGTLGRAGIGAGAADIISAPLISRAEIEAGNKALAEQIDLLNTSIRVDQENGGKLFDRGLVSTTGGLFGSLLGGVPSTSELLGNAFRDIPQPGAGAEGRESLARAQGRLAEIDRGLAINPNDALLIGERNATLAEINSFTDSLGDTTEQLEAGSRRVEFFNKQLEKGGEATLRFAKAVDQPLDETTRARQVEAATNIGATDIANAIRDQRVSLVDTQGNALTGANLEDTLLSGLDNFAKGLFKKDPAQLLREREPQLRAQFQTEDRLRSLQLEVLNPAASAIQRAAEPLTSPLAGLTFKGQSATEREQIGKIITDEDLKLFDELKARQESSLNLAKEFVSQKLDPNGIGLPIVKQFEESLGKVVQYGQQISDIQIGRETAHAAFAAKQYDYSIFNVKRSLQDALALQGKITADNGTNLGIIERQQYLLRRESQALSLEQTQRQLNFQVATAGLTQPGMTPEERAATIKQRKADIEYAQKQLDIQKKLFGLEGQGFERGLTRQIGDINRQLDLLQEGREIVLQDAAAQKKVRQLTAVLQREAKIVNTIFDAAQSRAAGLITEAGRLAAETSKDIAEFATDLLKTYARVYGEITRLAQGGFSTGGFVPGVGRDDTYVPKTNAAGLFGMTQGTTDIGIAGEAGAEAVAIVRDPRRLKLSELMGQTAPWGPQQQAPQVFIEINIDRPVVRREQDIKDLAREVEKALGARAGLLFGRTL